MLKPDYIYHNARIYTLDPARPQAEAVAVGGGRVLALGSAAEIKNLYGTAGIETVDLKGATLIPGLNDAHTHFLWWGQSLQKINLAWVDRLEEIVERVRARAEKTAAGAWINGLGWDKNLWGNDFPTKDALDRAAPDHPVALVSKDGHLVWVNSRALALCGIDERTPDPPGGEIVRDAQGQPTGVFKENARALIDRFVRVSSPASDLEALREALRLAHRAGLTGVHAIEDQHGLASLQRLRDTGELQFRVTVLPYSHAAPGLIELGLRQGFGDEFLRLGQIKFFLDGTIGSQTAAMFEPFLEQLEDDHHAEGDGCEAANTGILRMDAEDFLAQARHCITNGFAIAVHVIGDRAAHLGLDVIEKVLGEVAGAELPALPPKARNRLEHVQLLKAADLPRLARSGVIASVQPTHATTDRDTAERYWGLPRLCESGRGYAYQSLLGSGAHLALGSDVPIEPIDPLKGIYAAVARKRIGDPRPAWLPAERLTVEEAVRGFSQGAAYAAGEENWRGIIAPGFAADFTVLAQNIFEIPEDEIPVTPVAATVVAGKPVYSAL
jgi:predicted amidohydrolase YtcJ